MRSQVIKTKIQIKKNQTDEKNHTPAIKEFKNLEIIEVATDADPQISLQARRTHRNGVFFKVIP